ncbi:lysyl oxidase family protein [Myceligenerans xiligouense]|uniref:lysyl oxidase family protein n=1 Tax=Myceligenerans xiligouense TaxID=253184 RepID=UPI001B86D63F|nr:lysyl oxidase family protein [Myceligenerans xiligouense]
MSSRSRLTAVGLAGVMTLGLSAAQLTAGTASAEDAPAEATTTVTDHGLRITGPKTVDAYAYPGESFAFLDSARYLAAAEVGYEFATTRDSYGATPVMTMTTIDGKKRGETVTVPAELVDGMNGLKDGLRVRVVNSQGKVIFDEKRTLCPAGYDPQRIAPNGPSEASYPTFCGGNWFTRSVVFGVDQGWASNLEAYADIEGVKIGHKLTMTTAITRPLAAFLGISEEERKLKQKVTVRNVCKEWGCDDAAFRGEPMEGFSAEGADVGQLMQDVSPGTSAAGGIEDSGVVERTPNLYLADEIKRADNATASTEPGTKGAAPKVADPVNDTLPDLVAEPAWSIGTERQGGKDRLTFNAHEWNAGPAPLVVEGFRRPKGRVMDAYQFFYEEGEQVGYAKTGTMKYHAAPGHWHWHFLDFAQYELVTTKGELVTTSGKQSWCLVPTDPVDMLAKNAAWRPELIGLDSACGGKNAKWLRESLPVGWGDTYSQYQTEAFDLTGVPNGTYKIRITVNPDGNLHEVTAENNVSLRKVVLGGKPGARTVKVPKIDGVDTESGDYMFATETALTAFGTASTSAHTHH